MSIDIKTTLEQSKKTPLSKKAVLLVIAALVLLALAQLLGNKSEGQLNFNDVWLSTVQRGDLPVEINGFGQLKSKYQRLLTSPTKATVEEIFVYPGAKVQKDTIILRLVNPEVEQQMAQAMLAFAQQKAALRERAISQKREYLSQEATLSKIRADLEQNKLRASAEKDLAAKGIVSQLDYQQTKLNVRQLTELLDIETRRLNQLKQMHIEGYDAQQELLKQTELALQVQQKIVERLQVKAGIDGVLQSLPVKLGQSTDIGEQLALVGSTDTLIAQLRIPQRSASQIKPGDQADINTFGGNVKGKVSRIEPLVVDGSILVEIALEAQLPDNARPELSIEGKLHVATLKNALFIEQPAGTEADSSKGLFKLGINQQQANITQIRFGKLAGQFIQITQGANEGDQFIVSDTSAFNHQTQLTFSNR